MWEEGERDVCVYSTSVMEQSQCRRNTPSSCFPCVREGEKISNMEGREGKRAEREGGRKGWREREREKKEMRGEEGRGGREEGRGRMEGGRERGRSHHPYKRIPVKVYSDPKSKATWKRSYGIIENNNCRY